MKRLNCIVVFDKKKEKSLFCKRTKDPYKGLYNFVGGKVEAGESGMDAAYRELYEETGISEDDICLYHLMDITYYYQDFILEIYCGMLKYEVKLIPEKNPLFWLDLEQDFCNPCIFAGDRNIGHIMTIAMMHPFIGGQTPLGV